MIDEFITKVGNAIRDTLGGWFNLNWVPEIVWWLWWLFLLFVVVCIVIWLFGWAKIVRVVASMMFLLAAVFVAGGYVMSRRISAKQALADAKLARRQKEQARQRRQEQQQPWRWPWDN